MATLATNVSFQCLGLDGKPLAGGKVYTYEAGTTTPKSTYTTMAGDVPNLNPVILDQNGKAKIFFGDGAYRMRILDSNDALIDDIDQISRYVTQSEFATFQQTVQDGVNQLAQIQDQVDVFVETAITTQKGYAGGIAPLDPNVKIDPIYLQKSDATNLDDTNTLATSKGLKATYDLASTKLNSSDFLSTLKTNLDALGSAPMYACRAWVKFNATSGTPTIGASGNVSSITDNGIGNYTVNCNLAMYDLNFAASALVLRSSNGFVYETARTTSSISLATKQDDASSFDCEMSVILVR